MAPSSPFSKKTMLGLTRLSPHCYYPSLAYPIPKFVSNRAYLGSFWTASWASHEFVRTRGKVTANMKRKTAGKPWFGNQFSVGTRNGESGPAVFARYCVGNIIKEELIAITSLLTTTKGTDIEKEIDLTKIVSVIPDGAPNMLKELSKTFKFIMYPDVISFDKLNLSQFDWLELEELEMQLIDFQSSSIWIQKVIETRKKLELIEAERLTSN
ncbi:uncharacterized protein TNCV_1085731 [Trichonephila clavipes]|nr:uncharacterized protein TNCV_1085731 [Trichonephila clavipes]